MSPAPNEGNEWLEADGLGGFASGTTSGVRTRRYHALLLAATTPPTGRVVLVNGVEAWIETPDGTRALSSQFYAPDVRHPDGAERISSFTMDPWPTWRFRLDHGVEVLYEIMVPRGTPSVLLSWTLAGDLPSDREGDYRLFVRPLISGRDIHATHHENSAFRFDGESDEATIVWKPYHGLPAIVAASNGDYRHDPTWYRNFLYAEERARGLDHTEDLASPGSFTFDLKLSNASLVLAAGQPHRARRQETGGARTDTRDDGALDAESTMDVIALEEWLRRTRSLERMRRGRLSNRLERAADAYLVRGTRGRTVIAGYPWFTDWGRDTFTALRGLALDTGRLADAREILRSWTDEVSAGMLPNRFVEAGDAPEYNSVDAALWFVIAVDAYRRSMHERRRRIRAGENKAFDTAILAILEGYASGTRHRIRMDSDGLLAAGEPGVQLTWMDAKVGDRVITPRIGKPVEIQALWINALAIGAAIDVRWNAALGSARASFPVRFWHAEGGYLFDVVDVEHQAGAVDPAFRPNQIFAVGGLPLTLLDPRRARTMVDTVEARLLTPLGLRSLAPGEPAYAPHYVGGVAERDAVYHQGTAWPWLIGAFVEAWIRVRGDSAAVRSEARVRFVEPLLRHLDEAGLGHVSEIADAEAPYTPRGCPFQAWSVAEVIRADLLTRPGKEHSEQTKTARRRMRPPP